MEDEIRSGEEVSMESRFLTGTSLMTPPGGSSLGANVAAKGLTNMAASKSGLLQRQQLMLLQQQRRLALLRQLKKFQ